MNDIFLKLISPFPFDSLPEIAEEDLSGIKADAFKHNLLMLVISRLKKMKVDAVVERLLEGTKTSYLKAVSVSIRQAEEEKRILDALRLADVPALVIKGNALARDIYGDPNCRSSCDSDILLRKSDVLTADRVLKSLGYMPEELLPLEYCIHRLHAAPYYKENGAGTVEMHWNFAMPFFFDLTSEDIWKDVVSEEQGVYRLSPEITMLSLLIHHHTHSFRELRVLVDIFWAMHKHDDAIDWRSFVIRLREVGLLKTACITLNQLNGLWKDDVRHMQSFRTLYGEIRETIRKPAILSWYFAPEKMGASKIYKDRLVGRFALDRWSNITGSVAKTIYPPPEAIKGLYNDNRTLTLPYNYARYLCWKIKDWTGP